MKESSPVLAALVKENKLSVVAAFYDVETGKVSLLSCQRLQVVPRAG